MVRLANWRRSPLILLPGLFASFHVAGTTDEHVCDAEMVSAASEAPGAMSGTTTETPLTLIQIHKHTEVTSSEGFSGLRLAGSSGDADVGVSVRHASGLCHTMIPLNASSSMSESCPEDCPLYVEDLDADQPCTFQCVPKSLCAIVNPGTPNPDLAMGICRRCNVGGCQACEKERDICERCKSGYYLEGGKCHSKFAVVWVTVFAVVCSIFAFLVLWIVNFCWRKSKNDIVLSHGQRVRERAKFHRRSPGRPPEPWPLGTDLCKEDVGGPGLLLHFNFQLAVIIWGMAVALAWAIIGVTVDTRLLTMGWVTAYSPRDWCIVVKWGYETQHRFMWIKDLFVFGVYLFSFALALFHNVRQTTKFARTEVEETTMQDFTAVCRNLPPLDGTGKWEDKLRDVIQEATNQKVIGVSICWNFENCVEEIDAALKADETHMERNRTSFKKETRRRNLASFEEASDDSSLTKYFCWMESSLLLRQDMVDDVGQPGRTDSIETLLSSLQSCDRAYVIFGTESSRNAAVEAVASRGGFEFEGSCVELSGGYHDEPASVVFAHMATPLSTKIYRVGIGLVVIFLALIGWTLFFYVPYAYFVMAWDYDTQKKPGGLHGFIFTLIVIAGNQLMYKYVCRGVASAVGFMNVDSSECCYMCLYCLTVVVNAIADVITSSFVAYRMMEANGIHTHDGLRLSNVPDTIDIFQTYIIQKELGILMFWYAFPATFLLPFLVEPIFLYFLPYRFSSNLIRTHSQITRYEAESILTTPPMELGRYADILLNIILAVLIFFFPSGFTVPLFLLLVLSHIYVYWYDHYRVLRVIPSCCFSRNTVDQCAQLLMSVPCGILLACAIFKSQARCSGEAGCARGAAIIWYCLLACVLHIVVHMALILYFVPWLCRVEGEPSKVPYEEYASHCARSWFTANPVHCLRSKYVYKHRPPFDFYRPGKENLFRINKNIGQFYEERSHSIDGATSRLMQSMGYDISEAQDETPPPRGRVGVSFFIDP